MRRGSDGTLAGTTLWSEQDGNELFIAKMVNLAKSLLVLHGESQVHSDEWLVALTIQPLTAERRVALARAAGLSEDEWQDRVAEEYDVR